jgi:basic membrane protein A and related proteins
MARQRAAIVAAIVGVAVLALAASSASSTPKRLRVVLVDSPGITSAPGLGQGTTNGFRRAVRDLGLSGKVVVIGPGQDAVAQLTQLARQHYDLIVVNLVTPDLPRVVAAVSAVAPKARLLVPGSVPLATQGPNVTRYDFRVEEASYLAGYLAGAIGRTRSGPHVVSSVGGIPGPGLDRFIDAYDAGARKADPRVTSLTDYSYDFASATKCRRIALDQIAHGSRVVFDVAGACGEGALQAAIAHSVWGVGVDFDHASLGPRILTSVVKREGVAIQIELRAFVEGRLPRGGTTSLGLREGAVALGRISPAVPAAIVREVALLRAAIVRGTLRVVA